MKIKILLFNSFLVFLFTLTLFAGNTGKFSGRIYDSKSNEPLIGVNIIIEGTTYGAVSDIDGNYTILNIPPGTYILKASLLGYNPVTVKNILVQIDLTTKQDFTLSETVLEIQEVIITADRPMVQKDLTASTSIVNAEAIRALPIREFTQLVNLQAGVMAGHIRGGRSGETAYWVDGVPVTDVYDGGVVIEVGKDAIQELQLISGAFNAEYGQAMSGIVNISTKDGGNKFGGSFTTYIGDNLSSHKDIFFGIDKINAYSIRNFEGSFSGPVFRDKIFFYTNARYYYNAGWLSGVRKYNPSDITKNSDPDITKWIINKSGDGKIIPMNWNEKKYFQFKTSVNILPTLKFTHSYFLDKVKYQDFDFSLKYNPDGNLNRFRNGYSNISTLTHSLSSSTFYTVGISNFFKTYQHYQYENIHDPRYIHPNLNGQQPPYSFRTGGGNLQHFRRFTETWTGKVDLTSQVIHTHLIKFGAEYRQHQIGYEDINLIPSDGDLSRSPNTDKDDNNPFIQTRIGDISGYSYNYYKRKPIELSAYIQDKMEFQDMIVNVGIRADYFTSDGWILSDESDPNVFDPLKPSNRFHDYNGDGIKQEDEPAKTLAERMAYWYKRPSAKFQYSPRIGVAFPITDRGNIHFSYGYFFQLPAFDLLYQNPYFKLGTGTGNIGVVGNADLNPQQTVSYEIGVQQQLTDNLSLFLTGYVRDIRNLAGTRAEEIFIFGGSAKYSKYVNSDFGFVRGIIVSLNQRFTQGLSATLDYTYQIAKGNSSDPSSTRNAIAGGRLPETQLVALDWDQRHTMNTTVNYNVPNNWGVSFIIQLGSGTPYTPPQSADIGVLLINSEIKPYYMNVDFRGFKDFAIDALRFNIFTRITNLFDTKNEINVYTDTGRADFTIYEQQARLNQQPELVNSLGEYFRNPTFYSQPRAVELGLSIYF
ncbi:MAG: TonB-dependent receptor [Bacteroidota bacterium]|nr:TonB-dependent receptor [Bacteroidota bacterium]